MKPKIIWNAIETASGFKTMMIQTSRTSGFMFLEKQKWCEPCNRMCAHFGFAVIKPGPLGEPSFDHINQFPDFMI